ncbi:hypothetical protein RHGRI_025950 [Rhododendron griersonianum]|uniref:Protease Do-like 14 n=1 Tax=Rhododendron griersonianum TaxID=479676 RepID=A0AAV6IUE0_9ERIC|nr:hypothetical protein RHGRI_025950 [Rhododendron griersonianum]
MNLSLDSLRINFETFHPTGPQLKSGNLWSLMVQIEPLVLGNGDAQNTRVGSHLIIRHSFFEEFDRDIYANMDLDIDTKRAALKVSASVVSLVSLTGGKPFFMGSGTIIESEEVDGTHLSTILTSASLLRSTPESDALPGDIKIDVYLSDGKFLEGQVFSYDFHYNIAAIKIKTELALPSATLRILDDSISAVPSAISESFQLCPHSDVFNLCPGDMVVAVGRYFEKPNELMSAPGKFSLDCVKFDCKELFRTNCQISKCGIGGPLVNRYGEVIGVNFYDSLCTPFLPINIAVKCLEHFKIYGLSNITYIVQQKSQVHFASGLVFGRQEEHNKL